MGQSAMWVSTSSTTDQLQQQCLIDACRQGDREAFRRLFEAHKDRVYSLALHFFKGEAAIAEDITQDVFVRLFTRFGQFRSDADFSTYLHRMVVNTCIDEQRKRRRWISIEAVGEMGDATAPGPEPGCSLDAAESVQEALSEMAPALRMTVLLKYFDELSYEEMAATLGCSQGTVASRLHRGLKILARKLAHLGGERGPGGAAGGE